MTRAYVLAFALPLTLSACAGTQKPTDGTTADAQLDRSRCDPKGKKVVEMDLNHDGKPDVWKYYANVQENNTNVDVLTCKEVDLNFDRRKDMWVYYDPAGSIAVEEFDLDFDGKVDMRTYRQHGKIVREELDTDFDGKPDVWKYYEQEKLVRVERSSEHNGKVDVWEYYENGKLDRIGYDTTGGGKIDRWDRAPTNDGQAAETVAQPEPAAPAVPAKTRAKKM